MAIGQTNASSGGGTSGLATVATTGKGNDLVDLNSTTTTYSLRQSRLVSTDTNPTSNGQITWKYE